MLTLSEAEHGAYHNGNVSDVHNPQRIYDTLWMQAYPAAPRRDPTCRRCRRWYCPTQAEVLPHPYPSDGIIPPGVTLQIERRGIIIVSKIR